MVQWTVVDMRRNNRFIGRGAADASLIIKCRRARRLTFAFDRRGVLAEGCGKVAGVVSPRALCFKFYEVHPMRTSPSQICVRCFDTWVLMNEFEAAITSSRKKVSSRFSIFSQEARKPNHTR